MGRFRYREFCTSSNVIRITGTGYVSCNFSVPDTYGSIFNLPPGFGSGLKKKNSIICTCFFHDKGHSPPPPPYCWGEKFIYFPLFKFY